MDKITLLTAKAGGLVLKENIDGWMQIYLETSSLSRYIGADSAKVVSAKLLSVLRKEEGKSSGFIDKFNVINILNLSECRFSIYVTTETANIILFFQNLEEKLLYSLEISDNERRDWMASLLTTR
ncbi:hypothetical protein [Deinococcus sp.]|uniref:hypothetical protein n=1 Tax=Deinococcus sp. TaxID=47478 RepID=UPI003C7B7404